MNKTTKFKKVIREFFKDVDEDSLDTSLYTATVKVHYCPHEMMCENCEVEEKKKYRCRSKCFNVESDLIFRDYDSPVEFTLNLYKNDKPEKWEKNINYIETLIKNLQKFKTNYENGVDLFKENIENERKFDIRKEVLKSSTNNDSNNSDGTSSTKK